MENPNELLIDSKEEHSYDLVKLCSIAYLRARQIDLPYPRSDSVYFWSITFPPDYKVNVRGNKCNYNTCKPKQQLKYIKYLLLRHNWTDFSYLRIIPELNYEGNVHLHVLSQSKHEVIGHKQNQQGNLIQALNMSKCKYIAVNFKGTLVDDDYKAYAYMIKEPLDWVSNKDKASIDKLNISIFKKAYEKISDEMNICFWL